MDKPKQETLQQETPKLNRHQRQAKIAILKKKLGKIRAAQNLRDQQKNRKKKGRPTKEPQEGGEGNGAKYKD